MAKYYPYTGSGNYSHSFGWDNGLSVSVSQHGMTKEEALDYMERDLYGCGPSFCNKDLPTEVGSWFAYFYNEHGGSRSERGFILAESYEEALKVAEEIESGYEVIEYEEPTCEHCGSYLSGGVCPYGCDLEYDDDEE